MAVSTYRILFWLFIIKGNTVFLQMYIHLT